MKRELHVCIYKIFIRNFHETVILSNVYKIHDENAILCRLVQQELNVAYETSIFWSMFMLHKYS